MFIQQILITGLGHTNNFFNQLLSVGWFGLLTMRVSGPADSCPIIVHLLSNHEPREIFFRTICVITYCRIPSSQLLNHHKPKFHPHHLVDWRSITVRFIRFLSRTTALSKDVNIEVFPNTILGPLRSEFLKGRRRTSETLGFIGVYGHRSQFEIK